MGQQKILIIGIDGFTWRVGKRLIQENYMPTLGKLVQNGCHGTLKSVIPYETSPAWSSFQTGCYPAKTGIFAFHHYAPKLRQIKLNSSGDIRVPTIWELLSEAGKKVVSINMPMTSPPPRINGIIIPGLTCPRLSKQTVHPPEIYKKYIKSNPDYLMVNNEYQPTLNDYVIQAIQTEEVRCSLALQLMRKIDWDLFCVQIQSTDAFQHRNWWALDADAVGFTDEDYTQAAKFYQRIDAILDRLIEAAGESVLTVLVSDHGFCAKKVEIGINTWLFQNGYLVLDFPAPKETGIKEKLKRKSPLLKSVARIYGQTIRGLLSLAENKKKHSELYSEKVVQHIRQIIDLDRTFAFCLGGMAGLLYVTDKQQKERAQKLIHDLLEAFGPDTPNPLIDKILPIKDYCTNTQVSDFYPDYIISFLPGVEARISPEEKTIVKTGIIDGKQTGTHAQEGVFVLYGHQVKTDFSFDADIVDLAPTILSYSSCSVPEHIQGRVLRQAFKDSLDVRYNTFETPQKGTPEYSDVDQSAVEKQLKDLGYL